MWTQKVWSAIISCANKNWCFIASISWNGALCCWQDLSSVVSYFYMPYFFITLCSLHRSKSNVVSCFVQGGTISHNKQSFKYTMNSSGDWCYPDLFSSCFMHLLPIIHWIQTPSCLINIKMTYSLSIYLLELTRWKRWVMEALCPDNKPVNK